MNEKGKRLQRQQQEDATFNKMLICLACILGLELITLIFQNVYINYSYTTLGVAVAKGLNGFFRIFRFAGLPLFVLGCVWSVRSAKKTLPLICSAAVLWLWVASVLSCGFNALGVKLLCALPIVLAVLCAIWFLYQREFFVCGTLGAVGILALWVARQIYMNHPRMTWCGVIAVCLVMAAAAFVLFRLSKQGGKVRKVQVLPGDAAYPPLYLTCAVVAAVLVAATLFNVAAVGVYAIAVLAAWLFCLAVYYTVKLM